VSEPRIAYFYRNESYGPTPGLAFSVHNALGFTQAGADFELLLAARGGQDPGRIPRDVFGIERPLRIRGLWCPAAGNANLPLYLRTFLHLLFSDRTVLVFRNTSFLPFAAALKRLRGITVCYETHDVWSSPELRCRGGARRRPRYTRLERRWIPRMDRLISVSQPQGDLYQEQYPGIPVIRAPTGCRPAQRNTRRECSRRLGYIGSFAPAKYPLHVVIQALALCRTQDVRFVCVGSRTLEHRAYVEGAAEAAGVLDRVEVRGWATGAALAAVKKEIDLGVAILSDQFLNTIASPLKVLEYLSAGLPFVATRLAGIARLVRDGEHGRLVENTPQAWADAIDFLYADFGRYRRMADACHDLAREHSWENRARTILNALP
jgi:glycosyltransferase involved in cell wall biosynthesis